MNFPNPSVCKLCQKNVANQTNSHIVPKFLCKSLFESLPNRHAIVIDRAMREWKIQDIPKESYVLCNHCEQSLGTVETIFANLILEN